jgi:hypothetical protein
MRRTDQNRTGYVLDKIAHHLEMRNNMNPKRKIKHTTRSHGLFFPRAVLHCLQAAPSPKRVPSCPYGKLTSRDGRVRCYFGMNRTGVLAHRETKDVTHRKVTMYNTEHCETWDKHQLISRASSRTSFRQTTSSKSY